VHSKPSLTPPEAGKPGGGRGFFCLIPPIAPRKREGFLPHWGAAIPGARRRAPPVCVSPQEQCNEKKQVLITAFPQMGPGTQGPSVLLRLLSDAGNVIGFAGEIDDDSRGLGHK
jgi:hypothetical protein